MKLIMSPPSPFARKARVLLRETGLIDRVEEIEISSSPLASDAQILAANPTGKIPALIREDGPAIYDSRVITRYLDDMADAGLYPVTSLYEVLTLEATADTIMDVTVAMTYDARFRPDQKSPEWTEAQWGKAARAIAAINNRWMSHLSGPLNMAQIAVSCALSYVDLRHDARNWRHGNDALATWQAEFEARGAMQATKP
ncbi:glutathione S-transferase-like protein [Octadecabacter antarcticus 307]|uniref:Glutathione S-transferase-like protein n=1 Tax=Octadecabacter antarcticus 307 TaxID=391626 RepID=M9R7Z4_9RHOB|nr:glutathione S-transferase [Octadecabacter antarcticus]AGI65885.1 glutathione S-transferase-like protein [Octadecabacter antarcticus 307]